MSTQKFVKSDLEFRGVNKRGNAHTGRILNTDTSPAALAEKLYRLGHRWLTITRDGDEVGGITGGPRDRTWWGEGGKAVMDARESVEDEVDCLTCEDNGFTTTPGGLQIPCFDCPAGDLYLYHEREKDLAAMVHVSDFLPGVDPEYDPEPTPYG